METEEEGGVGRRRSDVEEGGIPAALRQAQAACSLHLALKKYTHLKNMLQVSLEVN